MVLIILAVVTVTMSQRLLGYLHGVSVTVIILDTVHLIWGMTLVAAICFVRWMGLLTVYATVAILLGFLDPDLMLRPAQHVDRRLFLAP